MLAHANEPFLSTCPRTGAEILLCSRHGKEYCYECPADYVETNREARQEAERKKAVRPEGDKLGKGLLVVGSHVRLEDRSGRETVDHLDGVFLKENRLGTSGVCMAARPTGLSTHRYHPWRYHHLRLQSKLLAFVSPLHSFQIPYLTSLRAPTLANSAT